MIAVNEISPGAQQPSTSQLQMQLIESLSQTQRVTASKAGDQASDSGMQHSGGRPDSAKLLRDAAQKSGQTRPAAAQSTAVKNSAAESRSEAEMRSVVEAQEQSETNSTLTAAFQARHSIQDLLSVIRDPEDKMLPTAPDEHAV